MAITIEKVDAFKQIASFLISMIPGGAMAAISDREKFTWKAASDGFDIKEISVGAKLMAGGAAYECIQSQQEEKVKIPRNVYGTRLLSYAIPIFDENEVVGSVVLMLPRLHSIARSFNDFAPIIADMFPEGAFFYLSDLEKVVYRQSSSEFDIPVIQIGDPIKENWVANQVAIKTGKTAVNELNASVYGVPVVIMSSPFFDEDNNSQVVGTLSIILPKQSALELRQMATNLASGLEEMSAVVEELATSASQINLNEQNLNTTIDGVNKLADGISDVLVFIKQIADETKMLGLNAAIEAARAGDAGRGFGVVAEEIRKLSDESKETVVSIRELITEIKGTVADTVRQSQLNLDASQEQAAATEEISASIEEIRAMSESLDKMAQKM